MNTEGCLNEKTDVSLSPLRLFITAPPLKDAAFNLRGLPAPILLGQ